MVKKEIEIKRIAEGVRKDYDYMDRLPLEGWFWEIIRRTKRYPALYKQVSEGKYSHEIFDPLFSRKKRSSGEPRLVDVGLKQTVVWDFRQPELSSKHYLITGHAEFVDERGRDQRRNTSGIPNPTLKYSEFEAGRAPNLVGLTAVKALSYQELLRYGLCCANEAATMIHDKIKRIERREETGNREIGGLIDIDPFSPGPLRMRLKRVVSVPPQAMLEYLAPALARRTIFLGISTRATKEQVMQAVSDIFDQYGEKRKTRVRTDKWKYYLVTYDLHEKENLTYPQIAAVLDRAYFGDRKTLWEKDVERYHTEAVKLIDKGKYRQYLSF